jgi:hypothetical protein
LRLDKNADIAGQPIKRIRELLRRMATAHWSDREIADFFHIDAVQARTLIDEIVARGFLGQSDRRRGDSDRFYGCRPEGLRLASARLLKPITRARETRIGFARACGALTNLGAHSVVTSIGSFMAIPK